MIHFSNKFRWFYNSLFDSIFFSDLILIVSIIILLILSFYHIRVISIDNLSILICHGEWRLEINHHHICPFGSHSHVFRWQSDWKQSLWDKQESYQIPLKLDQQHRRTLTPWSTSLSLQVERNLNNWFGFLYVKSFIRKHQAGPSHPVQAIQNYKNQSCK